MVLTHWSKERDWTSTECIHPCKVSALFKSLHYHTRRGNQIRWTASGIEQPPLPDQGTTGRTHRSRDATASICSVVHYCTPSHSAPCAAGAEGVSARNRPWHNLKLPPKIRKNHRCVWSPTLQSRHRSPGDNAKSATANRGGTNLTSSLLTVSETAWWELAGKTLNETKWNSAGPMLWQAVQVDTGFIQN